MVPTRDRIYPSVSPWPTKKNRTGVCVSVCLSVCVSVCRSALAEQTTGICVQWSWEHIYTIGFRLVFFLGSICSWEHVYWLFVHPGTSNTDFPLGRGGGYRPGAEQEARGSEEEGEGAGANIEGGGVEEDTRTFSTGHGIIFYTWKNGVWMRINRVQVMWGYLRDRAFSTGHGIGFYTLELELWCEQTVYMPVSTWSEWPVSRLSSLVRVFSGQKKPLAMGTRALGRAMQCGAERAKTQACHRSWQPVATFASLASRNVGARGVAHARGANRHIFQKRY